MVSHRSVPVATRTSWPHVRPHARLRGGPGSGRGAV